jgi:hypothetical protein
MRRPFARRAGAVLAVAGLISGPAAIADPASDSVREQSCRTLAAGTVGLPDFVPADLLAAGDEATFPAAPTGARLPATVKLRSAAETFNRRWTFATRRGSIYFKATSAEGDWRVLPLPACIDGRVAAVSVDDDELLALDTARRIFTMDSALKGPMLFNWTSRWGPPLWTGPGWQLPGNVLSWSWSVISNTEDVNWHDPAGEPHRVGDGKVSHIFGLRRGGRRITYWDPWLPLDSSYEMCGPLRGRFRSVSISASGSTSFVIGPRGDMFTRLWDFDISGSDPLFFSYSYEDQRGKAPDGVIQLPAPAWVRQPKVPGRITSAISIHKVGTGAIHRVLRVEGIGRGGRSGYWEKDITERSARAWRFHPTGLPLAGRELSNPARDTSRRRLGRAADIAFSGTVSGGRAFVPNFDLHCSPARLRVGASGEPAVALRLHNVDGLRQAARSPKLDSQPREQYGAVEVSRSARAGAGPKTAALLQSLFPNRFTEVGLSVTRGRLILAEPGWTLRRTARR